MNILEMSKEEIVESLMPKEEAKNTHVIQMNYPTEMKGDLRRCGNCGVFYPLKKFKRKKPGYDWKCKECRKYEVYND